MLTYVSILHKIQSAGLLKDCQIRWKLLNLNYLGYKYFIYLELHWVFFLHYCHPVCILMIFVSAKTKWIHCRIVMKFFSSGSASKFSKSGTKVTQISNLPLLQVCSSEGEELWLFALRLPHAVQERPDQARECRPPRHQESQKKERLYTDNSAALGHSRKT